MQTSPTIQLLRVYVQSEALQEGQPYWRELLDRAQTMGIASAAVLNPIAGYGTAAWVHGARARDLTPGTHVIVELSGAEAELESFRPTLKVSDDIGLVTLESVEVVGYGGHRHAPG